MAAGRIPTTANSPITAKGDLFTYSTAPARLAVGNDGETVVADSAATTGLRYSATPNASNPVLNSAFQVWQRGTSVAITSANTYTADRFIASANTSGAGTVSQQVTGDTTNLPSIQYCARFQRTAANTATGIHYFVQPIETINSIPFVGKTVTLSFYARKGANYSATSNALSANLISGTGTDQSYLVAWTGGATVATTSATLTSTWQRFTVSGTVATSATQLAVSFQFTPTGTAGAADYYEVTGVQIDVGSVALPFRTYAATIQGELAACQRYYYRINSSTGFASIGLGQAYSTTAASVSVPFPVQMRVVPTVLDTTGTAANYVLTTAAFGTGSNSILPTQFNATTQSAMITATVASGLVAGNATHFTFDGASKYLGFGAEL
jgi:hypothetical protein